MAAKLNKKQKKQLDVARKKVAVLRQQLAGAKRQTDDPDEVGRLEQEVANAVRQIEKIQEA